MDIKKLIPYLNEIDIKTKNIMIDNPIVDLVITGVTCLHEDENHYVEFEVELIGDFIQGIASNLTNKTLFMMFDFGRENYNYFLKNHPALLNCNHRIFKVTKCIVKEKSYPKTRIPVAIIKCVDVIHP